MRHQNDAWTSKKPEHQCASPPKQELGGGSATRALKLEVRNNRYFCEGLARPSPFGPKVSEPFGSARPHVVAPAGGHLDCGRKPWLVGWPGRATGGGALGGAGWLAAASSGVAPGCGAKAQCHGRVACRPGELGSGVGRSLDLGKLGCGAVDGRGHPLRHDRVGTLRQRLD